MIAISAVVLGCCVVQTITFGSRSWALNYEAMVAPTMAQAAGARWGALGAFLGALGGFIGVAMTAGICLGIPMAVVIRVLMKRDWPSVARAVITVAWILALLSVLSNTMAAVQYLLQR